MKHYICTGECGGVASHSGVCSTQSCSKHNQPLIECSCQHHKTSNTLLVPYLNFDGTTTRAAMEFYKGVFGAELTMQTFGEAEMSKSDKDKDYIVHADLKTDNFSFMASSGYPDVAVKFGDNINMSLVGSDETTLRKYFDDLSAGGEIKMPLEKQFWGDIFGMTTDKFGVNWMVNISLGGDKK